MTRRLLRMPAVTNITGHGPTSVYNQIKLGLMIPPIKITSRASAWPEDEIAAVNDARIAGTPDAEIRQLVAKLVARRKSAA